MPKQPPTDELRTLYRLRSTADSVDDVLELFDAAKLDDLGAQIDFPDLGDGVPAVFILAEGPVLRAGWCEAASATTRLPVSASRQESGALLVFILDGYMYVLVYGEGHRLVPDGLKDLRFGLRFVARTIDTGKVQTFHRRSPGLGGRTDITHVAAGAPWWMLSMHAELQVVRNLGGRASGAFRLKCAGKRTRAVTLYGGTGLRARFGLDGADLVADVREVARVLRETPPAKGMEIIDHLAPMTDPAVVSLLESDLNGRLARADGTGITLVPPDEHLPSWQDAAAFRLRVGSASSAAVTTELDLAAILRRSALQPAGRAVSALRRGEIEVFDDRLGRTALAKLSPYKCLEVASSLGSRRFSLVEGHWYELDAHYLEARRAAVQSLFRRPPSLHLPPWDRLVHTREEDYCRWLPDQPGCEGLINLDQEFVRNPLRPATGKIEICDALTPDGTMVLIKHGKRAGPLSHLFWQALNAVQTLACDPDARAAFAALVARCGGGRTVPPDFAPKKIVFAILCERNLPVTPAALPPFALLSLAETADLLHGFGIDVEVISISPVDEMTAASGTAGA